MQTQQQSTVKQLVAETERVIVVGSMNANPDDRTLNRDTIRSVQLLGPDQQLQPVSYFNRFGELGVSSITWQPHAPTKWYFTSGIGLHILDIETGQQTDIDIPKTRGIHEIAFVGDTLWISNTYFDEIIAFDVQSQQVIERMHLSPYALEPEAIDEQTVDADDIQRVNKFHCNQIFETYEGELYALVHHVTGEQLIKRIAQKLIKSQGNGGVMNIRTGERHRLALKAPHSVRKINDQYWIFDSGHMQINIYDRSWKLVKEVYTAGWGRGGDRSAALDIYYAGVSAGRKRYANVLKLPTGQAAAAATTNQLQFVSTLDHSVITSMEVPNVEQINNIYVIDSELAEKLLRLA